MIGIYKIVSPSGKIYIGQSVDIERRLKEHKLKCHLKKTKLNNSFIKYGFENHDFLILEECSVDLLNERERYYQDKFNSIQKGLNSVYTKTNDKSGYLCNTIKEKISIANQNVSVERRKKISIALTGKSRPIEVKKKISQSHFGITHSPETRKKLSFISKNISQETREKYSISHLGNKHTDEAKNKISIALKGRKRSEETKNKIRKSSGIKVIDLSTGKEYNSVKEVALMLKCNISNLHMKLKGIRNNNTSFVYK